MLKNTSKLEARKTIEALKDFKKAFNNLSSQWDYTELLNNSESITKYPFEKSFDELTFEVENWINSTVEELTEKEK